MNEPGKNAQGATPSASDGPKGEPWWKLILLYPTLAVSIVSAIPTYIKLADAVQLDVPFREVDSASREKAFWEENFQCAAAPFGGIATKHQVAVDAVVCPSGTVLVRVTPPGRRTTYKWVPLETDVPGKAAFHLIPAAHAQPVPPPVRLAQAATPQFVVLCQNWVGNGVLRRRIQDKNTRACFDERVNTYNGQVIGTSPAPCKCG